MSDNVWLVGRACPLLLLRVELKEKFPILKILHGEHQKSLIAQAFKHLQNNTAGTV